MSGWYLPTGETKGEFKARLQAEGRWDKFMAVRDGLKDQGRSGHDAWREAADLFDPIELPEGEEPAGPAPVQPQDGGGLRKADTDGWQSAPMDADVRWVYHHMNVEDVGPTDAPSPGAWWLLGYCRSTPKYLERLVKELMPRRQEGSDDEAMSDDGGPCAETVNRLLRERDALLGSLGAEGAGDVLGEAADTESAVA